MTKHSITIQLEGKLFQGKSGNIPALPIIITVPKTLLPQVSNEIRRYLMPGSFDVIPYTGRLETRTGFWESAWKSSRLPEQRKILIATTGVRVSAILIYRGL